MKKAPVGAVTGNWWRVAGAEADWFSLVTSYTLLVTAVSVGTPYQSDFFSDRQNFFETPSTRTKTSSSEGGVACPEARGECIWEGIVGVESGWKEAGRVILTKGNR